MSHSGGRFNALEPVPGGGRAPSKRRLPASPAAPVCHQIDSRMGPDAPPSAYRPVACALLTLAPMQLDSGRWVPLTPEAIAQLPELPAVFEIANLVRTVLYIGRAEGNLRSRLATLAVDLILFPQTPGGYYVRYACGVAEEETLHGWLERYRTRHGGRLPLGNGDQPIRHEAPKRLRVAAHQAA
jgi:hypothetical protein